MPSTGRTPFQRDPEQDFATLTELFAAMIESQHGQLLTPDDAWVNHTQILAVKLFKQACSVRLLINTTQPNFQDGKEIIFVDHPSATRLSLA
jgi:hypothetical protein